MESERHMIVIEPVTFTTGSDVLTHSCPTCESPEYKVAEEIITVNGLEVRNWGHLLHGIAWALIEARVVSYYDLCPNCGGRTVEPDGKEFVRLHCPKCFWEIGITITETEDARDV